MLRYQILGPMEVLETGGRSHTPTPPKVLRVLALLLLRANQFVPVEELVEELWGDQPPFSAVRTVQTYVYQLRKHLDAHTGGADWLVTKPSGYLMRVAPELIDVSDFEDLSRRGRSQLDSGDYHRASESLRRALGLWRGPVLCNVRIGNLLKVHVVHLDELRMRALELRIQADAQLGRHGELVGEMRSLVASHPLNEWFHGQLILSLSRCGRRGEALQAYRSLRTILRDQLGLDPHPELQRLQRDLLTSGMASTSVFQPHPLAAAV